MLSGVEFPVSQGSVNEHILVRYLGEYPIHNDLEDLLQCQRYRWLKLGQDVSRIFVEKQIHVVAQHSIAVEQIRELQSKPFRREVHFEFFHFDILTTVFREHTRPALDNDIQIVEVQSRLAITLDWQNQYLTLNVVQTGQSDPGDICVHLQPAVRRIHLETT